MAQSTINNQQLAIIKVLKYFSFFNYPPSFEEIYTFLPQKTSRIALKKAILNLERQKKIISSGKSGKYTLAQYSKTISNIKYQISKRKLNGWRFRIYIKLLSLFPQIKLVGLSGSIAMMNADYEDDIDLFIITAKNRLFTGRLIALILAQLLALRRRRTTYHQRSLPIGNKDKVCLNLFFDESNLKIPKFKQTEYVAHEVLQMKPVIVKGNVYEQFLAANNWVFKIFPNAKNYRKLKTNFHEFSYSWQLASNSRKSFITDKIESLLKSLQLYFIKRHQTSEIITDTQLWFHPEDFGERIKMTNK